MKVFIKNRDVANSKLEAICKELQISQAKILSDLLGDKEVTKNIDELNHRHIVISERIRSYINSSDSFILSPEEENSFTRKKELIDKITPLRVEIHKSQS